MEHSIEILYAALSEAGLKEAKEIALHSDTIDDFIGYMEFDLQERKRALEIASELL